MSNRQANIYLPIGSYDGAIKLGRRWIRARRLDRLTILNFVRWQGPPSKAIVKALENKNEFFICRENKQ